MGVIPFKQLIRHRKPLIAGFVIITLLCTLFSSSHRTPSPRRQDRWGLLDYNRTRSRDSGHPTGLKANFNMFKQMTVLEDSNTLNRPITICQLPTGRRNVTETNNYVVNMAKTSLEGVENQVFGSNKAFVTKLRSLTKIANALHTSIREDFGDDEAAVSPGPGLPRNTRDRLAESNDVFRVDLETHAVYFPGGHWIPTRCKPRWKVAIVIPFRDRFVNLHILLRNLIPFLLYQELEFGIFVAEQGHSEVMNRGMMRNIGYQLARNSGTEWDCYIFHDVDYVPMNTTNYYGCDGFPRHYTTKLEEFNYSNPFLDSFGGVVGLTGDQVERINGYSNMYWGWGGEDDDVLSRTMSFHYNITRPGDDGFYRHLGHKKSTRREACRERFCLLKHSAKRMAFDGLSAIRYPPGTRISLSTLFTNIHVDIRKREWNYGYEICVDDTSNRLVHKFLVYFLTVIAACISVVLILVAFIFKFGSQYF